jgi:hypothetical protein
MEDRNNLQDEKEYILDGRSTLLMEGSPTNKVSSFEIAENLEKILNFKQSCDPYKNGSQENLRNQSSARER